MTRSPVRALALLTTFLLGAALLAISSGSASWAGGITTTGQLADAPIPASCGHAATKLDGKSKDFGSNGFATLLTGKAVFGHLGPGKASRAVVPMVCSAGGVTWPMYLLVYAPGPRLVGSVDLGRMKTAQEHEDVTRLRFVKRTVEVKFRGYDGCCSTMTNFRGKLDWRGGAARWHHSAPLSIDYATGRYSYDFGPGIVAEPGEADVWLRPAPPSFRRFIQHRWSSLDAHSGGCTTSMVNVDRYSHRGFASGGEGGCGGFAALWGRQHGSWRLLLGWQDGPFCASLSRIQRAGLHAVGGGCLDRHDRYHRLGSWPRSAQ